MNNICYIQARGGSKRFPNKNLAEWDGLPMVGDAIQKAINTHLFNHVCVSSDSIEILHVAQQFGALPLWRTPETSSDDAIDDDVALEVMEYFKNYDYACKMYPCVPLLTHTDIVNVFAKMLEYRCEAIKTVDYSGKDAGAVYFFDVKRFKERGWILDSMQWNTYILPICQDINTEEDFREAQRKAGYAI